MNCKHCNEAIVKAKGWNHADGFVYCEDAGGTKAEPEMEIETHQGPVFRVCKNCGSNVVWEEDEWTDGFWTHDDGWLSCYADGRDQLVATPTEEDPRPAFERACAHCGITILWNDYIESWVHDSGHTSCTDDFRDQRVATPELPDEIAWSVESGSEKLVGTNSGSEFGSDGNSGPKNGSDEKMGQEIGSDEAQPSPVTPEGAGAADSIISLIKTLSFNPSLSPLDRRRASDALHTLTRIVVNNNMANATPLDVVSEHQMNPEYY